MDKNIEEEEEEVGWVLCCINPCRLFNTKSYINMICKRINILNKPEVICFHS